MEVKDILTSVIELFKTYRTPLETIDEQTLLEDLEFDSIHSTAALLELEDSLEFVATDEAWAKWKTIEDIVTYIDEYNKEYGRVNLIEL